MTPKEELIQIVEQLPDEVVQALLKLFQVLQRQKSFSKEIVDPPDID